ncbi:MAG: AmmeMemoRadiSam system protein B, partial [Proteobacteria bacterium]|nr:AmmeMemoRadiSam system protein B [Pseudomonadota bacterium]
MSASAGVRPPAVAGSFYPSDPAELANTVQMLIRGAMSQGHRGGPTWPKAIIAPHAGYVYSGPIAASVYARFSGARHAIRRIVLLGPAHRVAVRGLAVSSHSGFATPLGVVPLDRTAIEAIKQLPQVHEFDATHAADHSLEVQLPFLQHTFESFTLIPIVVGDAEPQEVAEVLRALWGGPETLIVISSDLSHYHDYDTARSMDSTTSNAIASLNSDGVTDQGACGRMPIRGLLQFAREIGLRATMLDVRSSGDTAGPRDAVVGYGAYMFEGGNGAGAAAAAPSSPPLPIRPAAVSPAPDRAPASLAATPGTDVLTENQRKQLLDVAARAISIGLKTGHRPKLDLRTFHPIFGRSAASFVTLTRDSRLRGCIGSPEAKRPLVADVAWNAFASAFEDRRFKPLSTEEFSELALSISLLSAPQPMTIEGEENLLAQLRPNIDGLTIQEGQRRATFLPQVWEQISDPVQFIRHLKTKA